MTPFSALTLSVFFFLILFLLRISFVFFFPNQRMTVRFKKRKSAILLGELSGRLSRQGDVIMAVCSVRPLSLATDEIVGKVSSAAVWFVFTSGGVDGGGGALRILLTVCFLFACISALGMVSYRAPLQTAAASASGEGLVENKHTVKWG